MKRTKTSRAWMSEHVNDFYVKQAKEQGYRSRAAFKLLEIAGRDKLFHPGMTVVDLGAAPGGWCQVVAQQLDGCGKILALDLLEMAAIPGVTFLQGDFTEDAMLHALQAELGNRKVDLVLSDMAPNMSGVNVTDQAKSFYLAELALDFAVNHLQPDGDFLVKIFQGAGFEEFIKAARAVFRKVDMRKPKASRDRSNEVYLLGRGLK